jgi:hypothetical protein
MTLIGNIQYAEQHDKGFPAESLPGVSSAPSCYVDECSPGELIRGESRGPDALRYPVSRRIIDTGSVSDMAGVDDLDPLGLVKPYIVSSGTGVVSKDYCGTYRSHVAACNQKPGDHKPLLIRKGCNSQQCPECWQPWGKKRSESIEDSLNG